ncbi:hypothetical protein Sango_2831800 [Sesamum angolense]|uniref:Uncharacterized protein n=1 Tax=Sesamum angolense TaxID=2727404 RepID=A0AAE1T7F3_9LAMI|nr:hypothetical protein Sango_2831800 [Sesamum angolense]
MDWVQRTIFDVVGLAFSSFNYNQDGVPDNGIRSCSTDSGPSSYYDGSPHDYVSGLADLSHDDDIDLDYCNFCGEARYKPTRERNPNRKKTQYAILRHILIFVEEPEMLDWVCARMGSHPTRERNPNRKKTQCAILSGARNARLGLCTDGSHPTRERNPNRKKTQYAILSGAQNARLEMCMSYEYIFLTMMIHGPSNPKCLIDFDLKLLIEELQNFGHVGVLMQESLKNKTFTMCAMLMWIVNDLPTCEIASQWSIAGVISSTLTATDSSSP